MMQGLYNGKGVERLASGVERLRGLHITPPHLDAQPPDKQHQAVNADAQSPASFQQAHRFPLCHNNTVYAPHNAFPVGT
jgi:hypothetical protein